MKVQAPEKIARLIKDFWEKNKDKQKLEIWPTGNIYVNHWEAPTNMVSVDDKGLRGSGSALKKAIWQELHGTIEDWTGEVISPTSMYGIRVYTSKYFSFKFRSISSLMCSCQNSSEYVQMLTF